MLAVGIDAGGTKTDFALCDENENIIKKITLGPANPNDIGVENTIALLKEGLSALCEEKTPDLVFAGVSGGGFGENKARIGEFLSSYFPNSRTDNGTDAINLIYCSRSKSNVGALICGTGTALFVRVDNEIHHLGGWGHLFEFGGSAYDFGRDAVSFMLFAEEEAAVGSSDSLSSPLFLLLREKLGGSAHEVLNSLYAKKKTYIASLALLVFEAYARGDALAEKIIEQNTDALAARLDLALHRYASINEIICGGGLFNSPIFFDSLSKKTSLKLTIAPCDQVVGACRRALSLGELVCVKK